MAGVSYATTAVTMYIIKPLKDMAMQPMFRALELKVYFYDYTLQATRPTKRAVARSLQSGAKALLYCLEADLGCEVSEPKAEVVASSYGSHLCM